METSPDSSGQRLRWWQEDTPKPRHWYHEHAPQRTETSTVSEPVQSSVLDLEEELEAEARRRAELESDAVVLEGSYANAEPRAFRNFLWFTGPISLLYIALGFLTHHWFFALLPLIFVAEYFLLRSVMRKKFANQKSHIKMSSLGLTVDLPLYRLGPVFWDEIASVRVINWGFTRFVRVKLKDAKKTHDRALTVKKGAMGKMARFSLNRTHIEIVDQWFPESAEEIAAKIATFHPSVIQEKK